MKRIYKLLIIILITICSLTLVGCDDKLKTITTGNYSSSLFDSYDSIDEYVQINSTISKINIEDGNNLFDNILFLKNNFDKLVYYNIDLCYKMEDMNEYIKINLSNISYYYNEFGVLFYTGLASTILNGKSVIDNFEILMSEKYMRFETFNFDQTLNHQSEKFNIKNYDFIEADKTYNKDIINFTKSKLSLNEIEEKDFSYYNPNQYQEDYGGQFVEIEFYFYNYEINEYVKCNLFFKGLHKWDGHTKKHLYGDMYVDMNGIDCHLEFKLYLYQDYRIEMYLYCPGVMSISHYYTVKGY